MDKTEMLYHQIYSSKRLDNDSYRLISNNHNQHYNLSQKIRFQMILIVLFYCFFTFCITYANTQETNYYYRDAVDVKNTRTDENNFESFVHKNFFSIFSSEMSILNSVENQSLNGHNQHKLYSSSESPTTGTDYDYDQSNIAEFNPSILDFREQPIGMPKIETVFIINTGKDILKLESIFGSTIHFHCSFFLDKTISPGANTSFDVYFLSRELGSVESSLYINTNKGIIKFKVMGVGVENLYKLKPILNARIPVNSSYTTVINLYNPHNTSLQLLEIFTSDDDLHIEFPTMLLDYHPYDIFNLDPNTNDNNISSTSNESILFNRQTKKYSNHNVYTTKVLDKSLWKLEPYENKPIVLLRYIGRQPNNHKAFVCIKATTNNNISFYNFSNSYNLNDNINNKVSDIISFVLPFELEVTQKQSIYSPIQLIDFGAISIRPTHLLLPDNYHSSLQHSSDNHFTHLYLPNQNNQNITELINKNLAKSLDLYLTNSGPTPLKIIDINSVRINSALNITYAKNAELVPDINYLTKIAEIQFNPIKSKAPSQNYGKLNIKTNNSNVSLQIDFNVDFSVGSLEFNKDQTEFMIQYDSKNGYDLVLDEIIQPFDLISTFKFPIVINTVKLNNYATRYFSLIGFNGPVLMDAFQQNKQSSNKQTNSNELKKTIFKIKFNRKQFIQDQINNYNHESLFLSTYDLNDYLNRIAKLTLITNYTSFDVPLFVYDGKLKYSYVNEESIINNKLNLDLINPDLSRSLEPNIELDGIMLNSVKRIPIIVSNFNPIDIRFDKFEIIDSAWNKKSKIKFDSAIILNNQVDFKFLCVEPLIKLNGLNRTQFQRNRNFLDNFFIPAHHRLILELVVTNVYSNSNDDLNIAGPGNEYTDYFYSKSPLNQYDFVVQTKYEQTSFKIKFKIVNGSIDLVNESDKSIQMIDFSLFPTQKLIHPINLKSKFNKLIKLMSIEFVNYGNMFEFSWSPNSTVKYVVNHNETSNGMTTTEELTYGYIHPETTTQLGFINLNPKNLCHPLCYLGIEPPSQSIITDPSYLSLDDLDKIHPNQSSDQTTASISSFVHDLWLKSFDLKEELLGKSYTTFDIDSKLFSLFKKRYVDLNKETDFFRSFFRIHVESFEQEKNQETKNKKNNTEPLLSYSYPVKFNFKWPSFYKNEKLITFQSTQAFVGSRFQNFTIQNPSDSPVLVQIMLIDNYSSKEKLLDFMSKQADLFYFDDEIMDEFLKFNLKQEMNDEFGLYLKTTNKQIIQMNQRLPKQIQQLKHPKKNILTILLEPFEQHMLQLHFKPKTIGTFYSAILIRNNLTILDSYLIKAESGSANLLINEMSPMKTSILFNGNAAALKNEELLIEKHRLTDYSPLHIEMNENDFKLCFKERKNYNQLSKENRFSFYHVFDYLYRMDKSDDSLIIRDDEFINNIEQTQQKQPLKGYILQKTRDGISIKVNTELLNRIEPSDIELLSVDFPTSYEIKEGIVLRKLFQLKNVGTSELNVYHIMLDGEPCIHQGFKIGYCKQFNVGIDKNNTAVLEILYQPDFTLSFLRKSLTLVTNIGDLEYMIEVKIPHHMLSKCHDSLPRPLIEHYLYYIGIAAVLFLGFIMLIGSVIESRSIVQYQKTLRQRFYNNFGDEKLNVQEILSEYQTQQRDNNNNSNNNNGKQSTINNSSSNIKSRSKLASSVSTYVPPNNNANNLTLADKIKQNRNNTKTSLAKSLSTPKTVSNQLKQQNNNNRKQSNNTTNNNNLKEKDLTNVEIVASESNQQDSPKSTKRTSSASSSSSSCTQQIQNTATDLSVIKQPLSATYSSSSSSSSPRANKITNNKKSSNNKSNKQTKPLSINVNDGEEMIKSSNSPSDPSPSALSPNEQTIENINANMVIKTAATKRSNKIRENAIANKQSLPQNDTNIKRKNKQKINENTNSNKQEKMPQQINSTESSRIFNNYNNSNNLNSNNFGNNGSSQFANNQNNNTAFNNDLNFSNLEQLKSYLTNLIYNTSLNNNNNNYGLNGDSQLINDNELFKHSNNNHNQAAIEIENLNKQLLQLQNQRHMRQSNFINESNLAFESLLNTNEFNHHNQTCNSPNSNNPKATLINTESDLFSLNKISNNVQSKNYGELSRSTSILSNRSWSDFIVSENNENFNKRVVTKSKSNNINYICNNDKNNYNNNNTSNEEDEDDDLDDFTDEEFQSVSSLDTGSFSSRSLNSSPTSDIWLLPNNHSSNDKLNDANYELMVQETEEFKKKFYTNKENNMKNKQKENNDIAKTTTAIFSDSTKIFDNILAPPPGLENFVQKSSNKTSVYSDLMKSNVNRASVSSNISAGKNIGPIQRPTPNYFSNTSTNTNTNEFNPNLSSYTNSNNIWPYSPDYSSLLMNNNSSNGSNANVNLKNSVSNLHDDFFGDFNLFGSGLTGGKKSNSAKSSNNGLSSLSATSSLWNNASDLNGGSDALNANNNNKPWNSVLLNDLDHFSSSPSSYINQIDSGNSIKSIWRIIDDDNNSDDQNKDDKHKESS